MYLFTNVIDKMTIYVILFIVFRNVYKLLNVDTLFEHIHAVILCFFLS